MYSRDPEGSDPSAWKSMTNPTSEDSQFRQRNERVDKSENFVIQVKNDQKQQPKKKKITLKQNCKVTRNLPVSNKVVPEPLAYY